MSVSPADVVARARRMYERSARIWVLDAAADVLLDAPLHPPTEREALADLDTAREWVQAWHQAETNLPIQVEWQERNWSRVGRQSVAVRVRVEGPVAIAAVAGRSREWKVWVQRIASLRNAVMGVADGISTPTDDDLAPTSADAVAPHTLRARLDAALRTHSRSIAQLDSTDARILEEVVVWLIRYPVSGLRVRQVPVRGIHTKWLERHRAVVEALVTAALDTDGLGLVSPADRLRISILDPALRPAGLRDLAAPIDELADLPFADQLQVVVIVENLETLLSLPNIEGVVAIHGSGYIGHLAAQLPWVLTHPVLYWGDLDSHGFAILNRVRAAGIDARSVLMDRLTLEEFGDLCVNEPTSFRGELSRLTTEERAVFDLLCERGDVRLEQERIAWPYAWRVLSAAVSVARREISGSSRVSEHVLTENRASDGAPPP